MTTLVHGWEVVIGLEIHCQLNTATKLFSGSSIAFGADPNTQANKIDLALPGVLPVLNEAVLGKAIMFGLGVNASICQQSVFARKNYFYPDLPKGYQISQLDHPIVGKGHIDITLDDGSVKRVGVTRAHLEEDAGKSLHEDFSGQTGIDLNRAGTPLIEIVSEPDMRSSKEAVAYVRTIHSLVRWLGISDGNMAEGSFRCDCNVSIRQPGGELGTRCELKNINSFKFIERAIDVEVERQIDLLESGGKVVQETRLFDPSNNQTRSMRSKEEANDYRYFPDPDLLPVMVTDAQLAAIKAQMPELPEACKDRFVSAFALSDYDARILSSDRSYADYFEQMLEHIGQADAKTAKMAANWFISELLGALNKLELDIAATPVSAKQLAGLISRILDDTISGKIAKQVFADMLAGEGDADDIITRKGLKQQTDAGAIEAIIKEVLAANPTMVDEYKSGKEKAFNGLVGQVMKASKGQANPAQVNQLLKALLS